jgi:hypothetical protein
VIVAVAIGGQRVARRKWCPEIDQCGLQTLGADGAALALIHPAQLGALTTGVALDAAAEGFAATFHIKNNLSV